MENTTHLFLAVRFNCNKCHDHPFERWTQDQYYELSAFFAQVSRTEDPKHKGKKTDGTAVRRRAPRWSRSSRTAASGEVKNIRTGAVAKPAFPFQHAGMAAPGDWQPPRANGPAGSPRRTIPISPRATSIASGAICSASASSSRSTTSAPAIRPAIRSCSTA